MGLFSLLPNLVLTKGKILSGMDRSLLGWKGMIVWSRAGLLCFGLFVAVLFEIKVFILQKTKKKGTFLIPNSL